MRGDVGAVEQDLPGIGLDQPDDHVEGRRLSRAVRAQQSDDLPLLQSEGHVVDDPASPVRLDQSARLEDAAADHRRSACGRRRGAPSVAGTPACSPVSPKRVARLRRASPRCRCQTRSANRSTAPGSTVRAAAATMTPSPREARQHRLGEMLAHLVQARAVRLRARRRVPRRAARRGSRRDRRSRRDRSRRRRRVGGADQRVQRERGRAIAARELLDERANARRVGRCRHGCLGRQEGWWIAARAALVCPGASRSAPLRAARRARIGLGLDVDAARRNRRVVTVATFDACRSRW